MRQVTICLTHTNHLTVRVLESPRRDNALGFRIIPKSKSFPTQPNRITEMKNSLDSGHFLYKGTKSLDVPLNTCPHYTDSKYRVEQTEFCSEPEKLVRHNDCLVIEGLHYDYSDRLFEWDRPKMKAAYAFANTALDVADLDWQKKSTARYIQEVLRFYHDKPELELVHVIAGVNRGNGYPYLVYGTR